MIVWSKIDLLAAEMYPAQRHCTPAPVRSRESSPRFSVVKSPQFSPPVLVMEVPLTEPFVASSPDVFPLSEPFVTPRPGLIAPGFIPVPPTPARRLQEQTQERSFFVRDFSNEEVRLQV